MMSTLYIIGNYFDLYHNLKTSTNNSKEILSEKNYNQIDNVLDIYEYFDANWSEFENSLLHIDLDEIEE